MNENIIMQNTLIGETVLYFNEVAKYINENIIDFNYSFEDFFFEDDDNTSQQTSEPQSDSNNTTTAVEDNSSSEDNNSENEEDKPKTEEEIQNQNKKMLDSRKWYQKIWDGIIFAWRWFTVNIKKFFLRITGQKVGETIFIDGPKLNQRIDSLIEQINSRNPNSNLKDENDINNIKNIYKALLSEIEIYRDKVNQSEVQAEGEVSKKMYATITAKLKSLDKTINFYRAISESSDGAQLYKAYMMELNHLKFLTKNETIKSYMYQNYKITKSYQVLAAMTDIFLTAFKGLQNQSGGDYKIDQKTLELFVNAFYRDNNAFEIFGNDIVVQALSALKLKMIYIYSTDTESAIDANNVFQQPSIKNLNLTSKEVKEYTSKVPELAKKFEIFANAITSKAGVNLLQKDLSEMHSTYNAEIQNSVEAVNSYFQDTEVTKKNFFQNIFQEIFKLGKYSEHLKNRLTAISTLMSKLNGYALKVIKMSSISSEIDKRFLALINAQKI